MVRILIAAATDLEVAPILERMERARQRRQHHRYIFGPHDIRVLITGVGMVATAVGAHVR